MIIKTRLENELKDAMRAGDDLRRRTLRMVLSAIKLAEVEKGGSLEEAAILGILQKEVKTRRETVDEATHAGRPELAAAANDEISVLEEYLPKQLTDVELEILAQQAILEVGASSPTEMGNVMKVIMPRVQGRADGARVSQMVRQLLLQS
jgi:uncharacterized protein